MPWYLLVFSTEIISWVVLMTHTWAGSREELEQIEHSSWLDMAPQDRQTEISFFNSFKLVENSSKFFWGCFSK